MRAMAVTLIVLLAAIGWQSWRLGTAHQKINTQQAAIKHQGEQLAQKNSQLIALNILTQTNSREQMRLYAAAENTNALLHTRQRRIEELTRENEAFRRWAAAALPDAVIRLRQRPAITGGQSYREWLSQNNALPPAGVSPTQ
jgi:LysB family phage lysis regulatory protein